MNGIEKLIGSILLKNQCAKEKKKLVDGFPNRLRNEVLKGISNLQSKGLLNEDFTTNGWIISIPKLMIPVVLNEVSSIRIQDPSLTPLEDLIPKKYNKPFLITQGEHLVKGGVAQYVFCTSKKDENDVVCILVRNGKKRTMKLGSVYNPDSLVSRFLKEVDFKIKKGFFSKEYLQEILPKEIVQNRQPLKALTDYLCHTGFLIRYDYLHATTKFQRTGKMHPVTTLDEILTLHESEKPSTMVSNSGLKYAYTETEGLYTSFY